MKTSLLILSSFLIFATACTTEFKVKSKALVISAKRFDNELKHRAKENFVDPEQQKVFADFLKKHSRLDLKTFEMKGDTEAVGEVTVQSVPRDLDADLKTMSGKDWDAKVKQHLETKNFPITMQKVNDIWELQGLPFPETAPEEVKKPKL